VGFTAKEGIVKLPREAWRRLPIITGCSATDTAIARPRCTSSMRTLTLLIALSPQVDDTVLCGRGHPAGIRCARQHRHCRSGQPRLFLAFLKVPQFHGAVETATDQRLPIAAERHAGHVFTMPFERGHSLAGFRVPEANGPISAASGQQLAIRGECHTE